MTRTDDRSKVCPTRADSTSPLFSHRVTTENCQKRQREQYHKCFTCVHANAYVAKHGVLELPPERVELAVGAEALEKTR